MGQHGGGTPAGEGVPAGLFTGAPPVLGRTERERKRERERLGRERREREERERECV